MLGFNFKKSIQVLNFFARKEGGSINKMKAIKLIWLADRAHLRKYGRPITNDRYYAMQYGPVPSNTKDLCECDNIFLGEAEKKERDKYINPHHNNIKYDSLNEVNDDFFSETDLEILDEIYEVFGKYEHYYLADNISHIFPEWKKHENEIIKCGESRVEMDYEDFFENPAEGDGYFNKIDPELLEIAKSIYKETTTLYS